MCILLEQLPYYNIQKSALTHSRSGQRKEVVVFHSVNMSSQPLVSLWQAVLPSSVSLSSWTSMILQVCSQTAFCVFSFPVGLEKCVSEPLLCDPSFNSHVHLARTPHNSRQHVIVYEVDGNNSTSTLPSGTFVTRSETKFMILYLFEVCNEDLCLMRR